MKYLLLIPCALLMTACATGYDPISHKNAETALDTIEKDLDPALPESYQETAKAQARAWVDYEKSKGE